MSATFKLQVVGEGVGEGTLVGGGGGFYRKASRGPGTALGSGLVQIGERCGDIVPPR